MRSVEPTAPLVPTTRFVRMNDRTGFHDSGEHSNALCFAFVGKLADIGVMDSEPNIRNKISRANSQRYS